MHIPPKFKEDRPEVLQELIKNYPLATLVTFSDDGIEANHVPLIWQADGSIHGMLVGHVARNNPFWQNIDTSVEALAIFHGPEHYISANWYESKQRNGKVVPTWNYMVVHAYGKLEVIDEMAWLKEQASDLSDKQEQAEAHPWHLDDAPSDYTQKLIKEIVGIKIPISRLLGKYKLSQNQPRPNQMSVLSALKALGSDDALLMALSIEQFMKPEE